MRRLKFNALHRAGQAAAAALFCLASVAGGGGAPAFAADDDAADFDVRGVWAIKKDGGYAVQADMILRHSEPIQELINGGYSANFRIEIRFLQSRWYWDRVVGDITWNGELSYDVLLDRYILRAGDTARNYTSLESALNKITQLRAQASSVPGFVRIFEQDDVYLQARFRLEIDHLPQPVQISLLLSNEWDITGPWQVFPLIIRAAESPDS